MVSLLRERDLFDFSDFVYKPVRFLENKLPNLKNFDFRYIVSPQVDYKLTQMEKDIVGMVEPTHPQLSPLIVINLSAIYSAEIGIWNLALRGMGKSVALKAIKKKVEEQQLLPVFLADGGFTPVGSKERGAEDLFSNRTSLIITDELAHFTENQVIGARSFGYISQLIYEKEYHGAVRSHPVIKNAKVTYLAGGTVNMVPAFMNMNIWWTKVVDRILRIYYFYLRRPPKITKEPPQLPDLPPLDGAVEWKVSEKLFEKCIDMVKKQQNPSRAELTSIKMMTGHARLCQKSCVDDDDAKWFLLYYPYIAIEECFTSRIGKQRSTQVTVTEPLFSDIFLEVLFWVAYAPQTIDSLMDKTLIRDRDFLVSLIEKLSNEGDFVTYAGDNIIIPSGEFLKGLVRVYNTYGCEILPIIGDEDG